MAEVWNLDQLENIGDHKTIITGNPIVGTSEKGKAVFFDGIDDGLIVESNPIFGSTPANPNTNLTNGALGYFGACAISSKTIFVTESLLNAAK